MEQRQFVGTISKQVMAIGSVLLAVALMMDINILPSFGTRKGIGGDCKKNVQLKAKLTEQQLAKLLTIPEGSKKQRVRQVIQEPYCEMDSLQVRVGATAQREAYPLEFDSQTWLVVLYEGDQYAGYRFNAR